MAITFSSEGFLLKKRAWWLFNSSVLALGGMSSNNVRLFTSQPSSCSGHSWCRRRRRSSLGPQTTVPDTDSDKRHESPASSVKEPPPSRLW